MTTSTRPSNAARSQVAQRAQNAPAQGTATLSQLIERMKPEMARALPKHMDPDRMARIALTVLRQTPKLGECTPESFLGALMTCAQTGLEPGPLGEAYLVPYGNTVTFIPGYKGLISLAWRSGRVKSITAETVHEHDAFTFRKGLDPVLEHDWSLTEERGKPIAWYAAATLKDGGSAFVVMSRTDVEAIRKRSRAKDSGPWVTDYDAMAKKTCIRQLAKFLPLSIEFAQAVNADSTVRVSTAPDALDDLTFDGEVVKRDTGEIAPTGGAQVEDPPADFDPETGEPIPPGAVS
jgi:recombination protein RecT